jgi:hypothetical protein
VPEETAHIWEWFCALSRARSAGFAVDAITWSDALAYLTLIHVKPQRWELTALFALDDAFLSSRADNNIGVAKGAKALKGKMSK